MNILHQSAKINFANNIICPEYMQVYYTKLVEILKKTKHNFETAIKINYLFIYFFSELLYFIVLTKKIRHQSKIHDVQMCQNCISND